MHIVWVEKVQSLPLTLPERGNSEKITFFDSVTSENKGSFKSFGSPKHFNSAV